MSFYVNSDYSVETVSVSNAAIEQPSSNKPREMEINGRLLYLDTDYIRSEEGIMKVVELVRISSLLTFKLPAEAEYILAVCQL